MGGMMGGSSGLGIVWGILNLVITVGVILGIVLLVIWLVRRASSGTGPLFGAPGGGAGVQNPREILQARYARGEITREQYQQILADLGS